ADRQPPGGRRRGLRAGAAAAHRAAPGERLAGGRLGALRGEGAVAARRAGAVVVGVGVAVALGAVAARRGEAEVVEDDRVAAAAGEVEGGDLLVGIDVRDRR